MLRDQGTARSRSLWVGPPLPSRTSPGAPLPPPHPVSSATLPRALAVSLHRVAPGIYPRKLCLIRDKHELHSVPTLPRARGQACAGASHVAEPRVPRRSLPRGPGPPHERERPSRRPRPPRQAVRGGSRRLRARPGVSPAETPAPCSPRAPLRALPGRAHSRAAPGSEP